MRFYDWGNRISAQDLGLAAAMSMILFVVLTVLSTVYIWLTRTRATT